MIYQKIMLKPQSGLITPLESDTVLSYIFAYNFSKLESIFNKFKSREQLPFVITDAFLEWEMPRLIYFSTKEEKEKQQLDLLQDIQGEVDRKEIKKQSFFPLNKEFLQLQLEGKRDELNKKIKENKKKENNGRQSEYKNSIPRFNQDETVPYTIDNVQYFDKDLVIFVKVFDKEEFDLFFKVMQKTLETVGFGKGKSRGYGHFKKITISELAQTEKDFFDYLELKEKEKNLKVVLNNYKPKTEELWKIDLKKSFIDINYKHTKSLNEFNKDFFKGQMNFIKAGSVLKTDQKLVGDFYQSGKACNFGFIF